MFKITEVVFTKSKHGISMPGLNANKLLTIVSWMKKIELN